MSSPTETSALKQGQRARRQNHSCDQCRRSKRACDAPCPDLTRGSSTSAASCSYCIKTKKRCTMVWARSRVQSSMKQPPQHPPQPDNHNADILFPWMGGDLHTASGAGVWDTLGAQDWTRGLMSLEPESLGLPSPSMYFDPMPLSLVSNEDLDTEAALLDSSQLAETLPNALLSENCSRSRSADRSAECRDFELDSILDPGFLMADDSRSSLPDTNLQLLSPSSSRPLSDSSNITKSPPPWSTVQASISPFSIEHRMMTRSNNHLAAANLLQIYHDVLEHNLSCWLSESTCPYQPRTQKHRGSAPEWGASWSNRIYQRTVKLDRVAQSSKMLRMTRAEDKAASKVFHLAIMAFATQWAQGSSRQKERYSPAASGASRDDLGSQVGEEFDRTLQSHFWDEARRTLQDIAHVESYRVACAEIILGLTQRPDKHTDRRFCSEASDSVSSDVRDIIRQDGPPIHMEGAARKMHTLKYRFDAEKAGIGKTLKTQLNDCDQAADMTSEDRDTIGLLYWLAIMFDTVSSSMNERPVVVLDEDCQHEAQTATQETVLPSGQWDLDLFVPKVAHRTHWPCLYETAAEDVTKSAPVKVILFRHVSYLQNAIRKRAHPAQIEGVIQSTLSLYQYWNKTHGAFFAEMMKHYDAVPQRIQGWFVCISAHWHLAALMLADLLELVDENSLGTHDAATARNGCHLATRVRNHSAAELSDLARVATPQTTDTTLGIPQMPDFHHAVNEGTLLTEPWTIIMIRAFAKACIIFLDQADEALRYATPLGLDTGEFENSTSQAEHCIKGMWLLGKKSDMARKVAERLSLELVKLRTQHTL